MVAKLIPALYHDHIVPVDEQLLKKSCHQVKRLAGRRRCRRKLKQLRKVKLRVQSWNPTHTNSGEVQLALRPTGLRLVRGFLSLEPLQRRMAVVCLFLLPAVGLAIRITRLTKLERLINRCYAGRVCSIDEATILERGTKLAHVVRAVAHYGLFRAKCLEQSLALWYLLRRKGVPAEIRFGARKNGDTFEAHAWVEYRGAILDDQDRLISDFVRFGKPLVC